MKITFNPFKHLIETKRSPHALTLRSSFLYKLSAAGDIFLGGFEYSAEGLESVQWGIFDWCTLGISLLVRSGWGWAQRHKNPFVKYVLGFFIGLIHFPLLATRMITCIVFILNPLTLFVTGMVHLASEFVAGGKELKETALTLELKDRNGSICSLKQEFDAVYGSFENPVAFDNLVVDVINTQDDRQLLEIKYYNSKKQTVGNGRVCYLPIFSENDQPSVEYKNMKALQTLIELNAGRVTEKLERTEEGKRLLDKIMKAPTAQPVQVSCNSS